MPTGHMSVTAPVLALSALLANSNAKTSAIVSAVVSTASTFSSTGNALLTHGGGTAGKSNADLPFSPKLIL